MGAMTAADNNDSGRASLAAEGLAGGGREVRRSAAPPARETGAAAMREASAARAASRPRGPELAVVSDLTAGEGLRLRLYRPALEPRPLTLYLHGGGFVIGDLESHDAICRRLAHFGDVAVLAVDYRRAPEHPAPAAVDDAVAAILWASARRAELAGDGRCPLLIAGDSSGGHLAALACLRLRSQGTPAAGL